MKIILAKILRYSFSPRKNLSTDPSRLQEDYDLLMMFKLQSDLHAVIQWAKNNNMLLNSETFELIHFGKKDVLNSN